MMMQWGFDRSRLRREKGSSLVLVLVFTSICLLVLAGTLSWSMTNTQLTQRQCQYSRSMAAAEAATEKVLTAIVNDFRNQGEGYVVNGLDTYRAMYPTTAENSAWGEFTFQDVAGAANKTYVAYNKGASYDIVSDTYRGLRGFPNMFQIISNVRPANSTLNVIGAVQQQVQITVIPIFQFAQFYNLDYECNALPLMTVSGTVHCNANIYLSPVTGLTYNDDVTAAGQIFLSPKTGNPFPDQNGPLTFNGAHDAGVSTLNLPIGTNNSSAAVHQVIEVPPVGESALSTLGQQRYYNKADLIIIVKNTNVVLTSGLFNNFATTVPWLQATQFVRTNLSFTNQRENKTIKTTEIDIGRLANWNATNTLLRSIIPGADIRTLFVADQRTQTASTQSGVRLVNGQTLLPQGLTVASPNPVYIKGHYNSSTAYLGTTNTTGSLPASIAADAITILSTAWNDANSAGALSARVAGNTTVNAALLTGIVQTSVANGYSGGIENFPRFLEEWTNKTLTYSGSMVCMFDSQIATGLWVDINIYYNPPIRNWAFDLNFLDPLKLPPDTPAAYVLVRGNWRVAQPKTTNVIASL